MADEITINGTPLAEYGASLLDYNSGAVSLTQNYFKADKRLRMTVFKPNMPLRDVKLKFEFFATSDSEAEARATALIYELTEMAEIKLPDGFYYAGVLDKADKPKRIAEGIFTRECNVKAYRHGELESEVLTESGDISVKGNYPAMARYRIALTGGTEFSIAGINIIGITGANIVIDGIDGLITEDGVNCFQKTDMTEFPTLEPGNRHIDIEGSGTVIVEYYPIYF